jgi:hypothetical protein
MLMWPHCPEGMHGPQFAIASSRYSHGKLGCVSNIFILFVPLETGDSVCGIHGGCVPLCLQTASTVVIAFSDVDMREHCWCYFCFKCSCSNKARFYNIAVIQERLLRMCRCS